MNQYLTAAQLKRNKDKSVDYKLNFQDFICQCYVNLNPNSYGTHIEDYISRSIHGYNIRASAERGDFVVGDYYFEFKASYLSEKYSSYSLTHLRKWQQFNYYLCCFIDCDDNFKSYFYLIDKNMVEKMNLSFMNGTPKSNENNTNVEMRLTVKVDSHNHKVLRKYNLLQDTSFETMCEYMLDIGKTHRAEKPHLYSWW